MPCKAPSFMRRPTCPGPAGLPATSRCPRCARGLCEAPGEKFVARCQGPEASPPSYVCGICMRKAQILKRRGSVLGLMGGVDTTGQDLQVAWTSRVSVIVQELWDECKTAPEPCTYAFCLAGSGARMEASPFSDLDCFILVEDDSPPRVNYFIDICERMKDILTGMEGNTGLRFCNIMSPFGSPGNPKAPKLVRTPQNMADLVEWAPDAIEGHISGGLQEHRFLFGTQQLYDDFKTDLNVVVAKTCWSFSSRPKITRSKKMGLDVIRELVNDRRFAVPAATDEFYHVKEQFYRPPQFISKGLAWYYSVDAVSTTDQLVGLVNGNHMRAEVAVRFRNVLSEMAKLRFKLHLDREGEKDFVYTNQGSRDTELAPLERLGLNRNEAQKERYNRLKGGTFLTGPEVAGLRGVIPDLVEIMRLARLFVAQKSKLLGKRKNPFVQE